MAGLRVITGPDNGNTFQFTERLTLGRSNSVRGTDPSFAALADPRISREHLIIYREGDNYFALDKYSSNGSYLEGQRITANQPVPLQDKAQIEIGSTVLIFSTQLKNDSVSESPPPAIATGKPGGGTNQSVSMAINAREWLNQLQTTGPAANALNLSRQIKAITQVSLALGGTTNVSLLSDQIIRILFDVFHNAENIFLFAFNEKNKHLTPLGKSNEALIQERQVSTTILNQVIEDRNAILIYDAHNDKAYDSTASIHSLKLRSVICAPLLFKEQILGLVQIDSRSDAHRFSEEDLEILTGISAQIAVALKNSDLFHEIENLLDGFVSASVQVIESRDPVTAGHSFRVAHYTENLAKAVDISSRGSLRNVNINQQQLRELRYASLLHDFGKVGVKEDVLTKENKLHKHEIENIQLRFQYAKACLERNLYFQVLSSHETKYLTKRELQERMQQMKAQLEQEHNELDNYLAMINKHNKPNLTHANMSGILRDIYKKTYKNMQAEEHPLLTEFEFSALQIPKGSLTQAERLIIETHVTHTYNFLNLIPWTHDLNRIPSITHAHHEKLDGSGYPNKLKAEAIPVQSRIMTIADIFDALTASDRPYKTSVVPDIALEMLEQEAREGKIDSELVNVFIESKAYIN